jgi:hypothetical protein
VAVRVRAMVRAAAGPAAPMAATGPGSTHPEAPATPAVVTATGRAKDARRRPEAIQEPREAAPRAPRVRVDRVPGWARDQGPAPARQEAPAPGQAWAAAQERPGPAHFHVVALMPPTGPLPPPRRTAVGRAEVACHREVAAGPAPAAPAAAQVGVAVGDVLAATGARGAGSEAEKNSRRRPPRPMSRRTRRYPRARSS